MPSDFRDYPVCSDPEAGGVYVRQTAHMVIVVNVHGYGHSRLLLDRKQAASLRRALGYAIKRIDKGDPR